MGPPPDAAAVEALPEMVHPREALLRGVAGGAAGVGRLVRIVIVEIAREFREGRIPIERTPVRAGGEVVNVKIAYC